MSIGPFVKRRGFTLLELIVAIAIFSVMAVFGYQGLRNFIAQRAMLDSHEERFISLVSAISLLEQDFANVIVRPVRDQLGDPVAAVNGQGGAQAAVALTRQTAWAPLADATSDLRRIEYRVEDDRLIRRTWSVLDRLPDSSYTDKIMLRDVAHFEVQYFGETSWVDAWPQTRGALGLGVIPRAVSVVLDFRDGRRLERVFMVGGTG